jgi:predicted GNAT family acetyltransferase
LEIKKIEVNKLEYKDLLLEADPEIDVVEKYIDTGDMYVLFEDDGTPVAEIIITKVNDEECELKNIATSKLVRGKGYAGILISHVFEIYSKEYKKHLQHLLRNAAGDYCINNTLNYRFVWQERLYPDYFFSSSTVGAESLYLKRLIFCVAVFSKGSFITSTELTCEDLFTFLFVMFKIFAFQRSSFS